MDKAKITIRKGIFTSMRTGGGYGVTAQLNEGTWSYRDLWTNELVGSGVSPARFVETRWGGAEYISTCDFCGARHDDISHWSWHRELRRSQGLDDD